MATVGGSDIAHFADKYYSEDSKLLMTQTTYEVTAAFICILEGEGLADITRNTYMVCTYVHTYVHMYIHNKIVF